MDLNDKIIVRVEDLGNYNIKSIIDSVGEY
jgi:hypothetical protein